MNQIIQRELVESHKQITHLRDAGAHSDLRRSINALLSSSLSSTSDIGIRKKARNMRDF
ncbi:hypothetical protein CY34DRAFT_810555 [Suillus luteus UH-Slu-Lm8-n1]|uniref:Uncharacterized protein n=1 Tax=Suillus luteus UH-Slu-Lm8-n1 TaxID=930992 RepID=A0A0D0A6H5_9AGAM|nr:hypothetical protein CY34DRAFT_810555 [Suillus luteus UH-Slu-Lm8-n1]